MIESTWRLAIPDGVESFAQFRLDSFRSPAWSSSELHWTRSWRNPFKVGGVLSKLAEFFRSLLEIFGVALRVFRKSCLESFPSWRSPLEIFGVARRVFWKSSSESFQSWRSPLGVFSRSSESRLESS